jgi:hypothetical protein
MDRWSLPQACPEIEARRDGLPKLISQSSIPKQYLDFFPSICLVIEPLNGRQEVLNISFLQLTPDDLFMLG